MAAAGREDKRVTCMELSNVGLFSQLTGDTPKEKKKENKTVPSNSNQMLNYEDKSCHSPCDSAVSRSPFAGTRASPSHGNQYRTRSDCLRRSETLHRTELSHPAGIKEQKSLCDTDQKNSSSFHEFQR